MKNHFGCPVQGTINVLSGKWKVLVVWHLGFQPRRFAELRDLLPGVSEKVLAAQLRELEKDGVIQRKIKSSVPPQVTRADSDDDRALPLGHPASRHSAESSDDSPGRQPQHQISSAKIHCRITCVAIISLFVYTQCPSQDLDNH